MLGEVDLASLKEKFVKKDFDERLTPALEYAYRAYQNKLLEADKPNQYVAEFEDWANEITNAKKIPQTPEEFNQLSELLTSTLHVGMDGDNATNAIRELLGDEELYDTIYAVSQSQGEDADARPIIIGWLSNNASEVLNHVAVPDEMKQGDAEEPTAPAAAPTKLGPRHPVPPAPEEVAESIVKTPDGEDYDCRCFEIGDPWVDVDPDCPTHGKSKAEDAPITDIKKLAGLK